MEEKAGNQADAIEQYRAIINRDPRNLAALNNLACALTADNPDEALKYAQSAVEVAPEEPAAQDTLGWIYYRKGIYREAVTYLKRAVDKQATPPRQYHLGMAYSMVGEKRLATHYLSAALDKDSSLRRVER
jgi:tetratricopeptide (TPR) repeat protein